MNQTDPTADFDGCNRKCRKAGAHTRVWGECEFGIQPEPTVSMSRVYTDFDGQRSIGFDVYTAPQLAELITAGLRASDLPVDADDFVDIASVAAYAIVHRNDEPAAASAVVSPPTDRAAVLLDAADALGRMDYDTDSNDYGYDTYRDAWNGGVMDGADKLRRLAVEAHDTGTQQQGSEALPSINANDVQGFCPACGHPTLYVGAGGHLTCSLMDCPKPEAADELLTQPAPVAQQPAADTWFDRTICPEPCGAMHTRDTATGRAVDDCPHEQQAAAADGEETPFLTRVLELFSLSHADLYDGALFWRVNDGHVHLFANVSDVFAWGGADCEPITPDTLPALEQAYADLKAIDADLYLPELYTARQRGERPQGAAYPDDKTKNWRQVSALFDACGPERPLGLGNPKAAPAHRDQTP